MIRPAAALAAAATVALLAGCAAASAAPTTPARSSGASTAAPTRAPVLDGIGTVAVLGDSITLGVNACPGSGRICASGSWATGSDATVDSLRSRADAQAAGSGTPPPQVLSFARDGAHLASALQYLDVVAEKKPGLVVILLGANDACAPSIDAMTSAADYRAELTTLLAGLRARLPTVRMLVMSVPDIGQVWQIGRLDATAVRMWDSSTACRSLLEDPTSDGDAARTRRAEVARRVDDFDGAIADVCLASAGCFTDGGALHAHRYDPDEISDIDHFHPSLLGQRMIAQLVWASLVKIPGSTS